MVLKPIRFYNQKLVITKVKYLGVILDSRLSWKSTCRYKVPESNSRVQSDSQNYWMNLGLFTQDSALALYNGNTANDHIMWPWFGGLASTTPQLKSN